MWAIEFVPQLTKMTGKFTDNSLLFPVFWKVICEFWAEFEDFWVESKNFSVIFPVLCLRSEPIHSLLFSGELC